MIDARARPPAQDGKRPVVILGGLNTPGLASCIAPAHAFTLRSPNEGGGDVLELVISVMENLLRGPAGIWTRCIRMIILLIGRCENMDNGSRPNDPPPS
jgi:hypothetical protein